MKFSIYLCLFFMLFGLAGCHPNGLVSTPLPTPLLAVVPVVVDTPAFAPTETAVPILPPTVTTLPTATPTATAVATLPPGWVNHDLGKVSLALPATYLVLDLSQFPLEEGMGPLSESCQAELQDTEIAVSTILLTAADATILSGIPTIVMLVEEPLPPAVYLEQILKRLEVCADLEIIEQGTVMVSGREAGRVVVETDAFGSRMKEIVYLFTQDNWLWSLIYVFAPKDEVRQTDTWQQINESFFVKPSGDN